MLGNVMSLVGGICSMCCSLLLPSSFFLLLFWRAVTPSTRAAVCGLLLGGLALLLLITAENVADIMRRLHHSTAAAGAALPHSCLTKVQSSLPCGRPGYVSMLSSHLEISQFNTECCIRTAYHHAAVLASRPRRDAFDAVAVCWCAKPAQLLGMHDHILLLCRQSGAAAAIWRYTLIMSSHGAACNCVEGALVHMSMSACPGWQKRYTRKRSKQGLPCIC